MRDTDTNSGDLAHKAEAKSDKLISVQRIAEVARSLAGGISPNLGVAANGHATAIFLAIARVFDEAAKLGDE